MTSNAVGSSDVETTPPSRRSFPGWVKRWTLTDMFVLTAAIAWWLMVFRIALPMAPLMVAVFGVCASAIWMVRHKF